MVDLYKSKGFSEEEARDILEIMAKHKNFFVDHMMIQVIMSIDCLFLLKYYYLWNTNIPFLSSFELCYLSH